MSEYAVLDTHWPKTVVNLVTSERALHEVQEFLAEAYPHHRYEILPAEVVSPRLLKRYLKTR